MCFFGKVFSVFSRNCKKFSLIFNQFKENTRARQIADVPRHIRFSYELNLTERRLRLLSNFTPGKCYLLPKQNAWLGLIQKFQAWEFNYGTLTFFIGTVAKLRCVSISLAVSVCLSVRLSVRPSSCNNSAPTWWNFINFCVWIFFENRPRKLKFL